MKRVSLAILAGLLLSGCSHRGPVATVEVIDTSLSITPRAEKAALDAVRSAVARPVHLEGVFEPRDARLSASAPRACAAERSAAFAFEPRRGAVARLGNRDARDA